MKNKLILKSISSSEVDINNWQPSSNDEVFICLDLEIASDNIDDGSNMFYVTLATPEALRKNSDNLVLVKNRTIVISEYHWDNIHKEILEILNECSRENWNESCTVLQRYFQWEYEDYFLEE